MAVQQSRYKLPKVYVRNRNNYVLAFSNDLCFLVSGTGDHHIDEASIDYKSYHLTPYDKLDSRQKQTIDAFMKSTEQFEVSVEYRDGEFWKNGTETINVNTMKQDPNMHEHARLEFTERYADRYGTEVHIKAIKFC